MDDLRIALAGNPNAGKTTIFNVLTGLHQHTGNFTGAQAATVLVPKGPAAGTLSDVATKPMLVAGTAGWREAARRMGTDAALLIDANGEVHASEALARRLEFLDKATVVRRVP